MPDIANAEREVTLGGDVTDAQARSSRQLQVPARQRVAARTQLDASTSQRAPDALGAVLRRAVQRRALLQRYQYVAPNVWRDGATAPQFPSQRLDEGLYSAT